MAQATRITMGISRVLCSSTLLTVLFLTGCFEKEQADHNTSKSSSEEVAVVPAVAETAALTSSTGSPYDCTTPTGTIDKRFWCLGLQAWQNSQYQNQSELERNKFIEAWQSGAFDAQQALDPVIEKLKSSPVALAGYESGYIGVLDAMGIVEYECSDGPETNNEYRDRWCEGASAFNVSRLASPANVVLRNTYINGYMSGRAIALTLPTSMESLFGNEVSVDADSKQAIDEPESTAPKPIKIFYQGFNDGFKAMLDTVRESVNEVMQQMQSMEGMPGPGMEGFPDLNSLPPDMLQPVDPTDN